MVGFRSAEGDLLSELSAIERAQPSPVISRIDLQSESGDVNTLVSAGGTDVSIPPGMRRGAIVTLLRAHGLELMDASQAEEESLPEIVDVRTKWYELLFDSGTCVPQMGNFGVALRVISILRSGTEAVITITSPQQRHEIIVNLDDGEIPLGLLLDIAPDLAQAELSEGRG